MTLESLDELERCAEPITVPERAHARARASAKAFERAAAPYRALVRSARALLLAGRSIGPELERELTSGARGLATVRSRVFVSDGD